MSAARRARGHTSQPKKETYSRADEALWDDEYLLKLFNEQLGNSGAVSEVPRGDHQGDLTSAASSSHSTSSSDRAQSGEAAASASSGSRSSASSSSSSAHRTRRAAVPVDAAGSFASLQLPKDVRALVQSFYNAGFEAGRYVGRAESAKRDSRKRTR